jgi:cytochrome c peroxidase
MKWLFMVFFMLLQAACIRSKRTESNVKVLDDSVLLRTAAVFFKPVSDHSIYEKDPVGDVKVKLGYFLFYDRRLSKSGTMSCNGCHRLDRFGMDNKRSPDVGEGNPYGRNVPTVFNAALHNMFFWDGRATSLEEQPGKMVLNPDEIAIPHLGFIVNRLRADTMYQRMFRSAFPADDIPVSYGNAKRAIAAFERTLLSPSRFDMYMDGDLQALDSEEKAGLLEFINTGCAGCHGGVALGGTTIQRFGIYTDYRTLAFSRVDDEGRMRLSGDSADRDRFKVPGLRNVQETYPYFHNGSVASLDSSVKVMAKAELNRVLTNAQITSIVLFLNALTGDIREEAKLDPFGSY